MQRDTTRDIPAVSKPYQLGRESLNAQLKQIGLIPFNANFLCCEYTQYKDQGHRYMSVWNSTWQSHRYPEWLEERIKEVGDPAYVLDIGANSFIDHVGTIRVGDEYRFVTQPYLPHIGSYNKEFCLQQERKMLAAAHQFCDLYDAKYTLTRPGPWHMDTVCLVFRQKNRKDQEPFIERTKVVSAKVPPIPSQSIPIDEVRNLPPFSGVYIAYVGDQVVYVGEGQDVSDRCKKGRPELNDCTHVSVIRCAGYERLRIEAYYVGLFDPPRNEISTNGRLDGRSKRTSDPAIYRAEPTENDDPLNSITHWNTDSGLFQVTQDGELLLPNIHKLNDCTFRFDPALTHDDVNVVRLLPGTFFGKKAKYWNKPSSDLSEFTREKTHVWVRRLQSLARAIHAGNVVPAYEDSPMGVTTWTAADAGEGQAIESNLDLVSPQKIDELDREIYFRRMELAELDEQVIQGKRP